MNILAAVVLSIALTGCGVMAKKAAVEEKDAVPSRAEADSICRNLIPNTRFVSFVAEEEGGPVVYCAVPHPDSAQVKIITVKPVKHVWTLKDAVDMVVGDELGLPFVDFADSSIVRVIGGREFLTYVEQRSDGKAFQRTVVAYSPADVSMNSVSFNGRVAADGKVKGSSDINIKEGKDKPEMKWAEAKLESFGDLVFLAEPELMSLQALEWWQGKNPAAMTSATKIVFGQLPAGSSLVEQYKKCGKEKNQKFNAALFDTDEHTVIVAQNRSTGQYLLVWAEPVCADRKNGRLLNTIYFSNGGSNLVMFYYKGKNTFKYRLNLANGVIQR